MYLLQLPVFSQEKRTENLRWIFVGCVGVESLKLNSKFQFYEGKTIYLPMYISIARKIGGVF